MTTPQEQYAELAALAQLYIFQEYPQGSWILADSEAFNYFKAYALQNRPKAPALAPVPQASALQATAQEMHAPLPRQPEPLPQPPIAQAVPRATETSPKAPPMAAAASEAQAANPLPPPPQDAAEAKKPPKEVPQGFKLEPMTDAPDADYSELKKVFTERFPNVRWIEAAPSDAKAKEAGASTEAEVVILVYQESGKNLAFIHNLAKAVERNLAPTAVVSAAALEASGGWEQLLKNKRLRLLVTSFAGAQTLPGLMRHMKESPKKGLHHFGKAPVCLLSDIAIYMREPQLKLPLWQSICALLSHG